MSKDSKSVATITNLDNGKTMSKEMKSAATMTNLDNGKTMSKEMNDEHDRNTKILASSLIISPAINDVFFKCLRVYTQPLPHHIPNVTINAIDITESAQDLLDTVDEISFLWQQCISVLKPHAMVVAFDLLQHKIFTEAFVMSLEDETGNRLFETEESMSLSTSVNSQSSLTQTRMSTTIDDVSASETDFLVFKYDRIKTAMAKKLLQLVATEAKDKKNSRMLWLEKVCTTLTVNGIDSVDPWLTKLSAAIRRDDSETDFEPLKWKIPEGTGLNASTELRLTTEEMWDEICTTLEDNLIVDGGVIEGLSENNIINTHHKLSLLSLPHRKAKVRYLITHMYNMGATVMYLFGSTLQHNNQEHLGRIVQKRLDDNKAKYSVEACKGGREKK